MIHNSIRPPEDVDRVVNMYGTMIFRICLVILGNEHDSEDAVQETFLRFMTKAIYVHDIQHEKAWLIRTATNICKDMKRYRLRHIHINIDDLNDYLSQESDRELIESTMLLPDKYKTVIHLHYMEGYKTEEIASILKISPETARKRLQYARQKLKLIIEPDDSVPLLDSKLSHIHSVIN